MKRCILSLTCLFLGILAVSPAAADRLISGIAMPDTRVPSSTDDFRVIAGLQQHGLHPAAPPARIERKTVPSSTDDFRALAGITPPGWHPAQFYVQAGPVLSSTDDFRAAAGLAVYGIAFPEAIELLQR